MAATQRVLCALCALWAAAVCAASAANETHCESLRRNLGSELGSARYLSERGAKRELLLAGSGDAARAAHALLRALLVHVLHYDESVVKTNDSTTLQDLRRVDDDTNKEQFILSVTSAWNFTSPTLQQCAEGACSVAGPRLEVVGAGAVQDDRSADDAEKTVWLAPPSHRTPHAAPRQSAASLLVADARRLARHAPPVMQLALQFQPPPALLRRILIKEESLTLNEAACEAANFYQNNIRAWLACDDTCDPKPVFYIYVCDENFSYYTEICKEIYSYWITTHNKSDLIRFAIVNTNCSDTNDVLDDFKARVAQFQQSSTIQGLIAMGAAAASSLRTKAAEVPVPLLLVAAPPQDEPTGAARSTAADLTPLANATSALLDRCGWQRVALLREAGNDRWKRSMGLGSALRDRAGAALVLRELVVQEKKVDDALDALATLGARVVLVDASARTAALVLAAAQARALAPSTGYAWIVLGAASNVSESDWRPSSAQFSYVSVSGGWRGGNTTGLRPQLGGDAALRKNLDKLLRGVWAPHAAPLADALLLALEGTTRLRQQYPQYRYDLHWRGVDRAFFNLLDNVTVRGVTHDMRQNSSQPVFAHLWSADGARLVGVWNASGGVVEAAEACGGVQDAPVCHTTRSGDPFTPHCHDFAWAVAACVLALSPPALWAAHAAWRRRMARRDRAVEERALLRTGKSAGEAAAATALAEHAVPRSALRLIDELGAGHYGVVQLAELRAPGGDALTVAAKAPRVDAPAGAAVELLREAALLATLRHEHVVRFAGVCWEGGPLMLMEHAFHGDLRRYLRRRRLAAERARAGVPEPEAAHVTAVELTRLAREAAAALGYLARRRLVHRDVRAANCLVDARHSLKLGDFGMARQLDPSAGEGEYACKRRAMFPVLWMPPESLARGVFSTASDVWALGVLLLELATLGERPYGAWSVARVVRHVRDRGGAPLLPRDAATSTRDVTAACWRREPELRLTAERLEAYLAADPHAVRPALEPSPADTEGPAPPSPDYGLYIDEWTVD